MSKEAVSLTVDQLKELLQEMRRPVLTEDDIRRIEQKKRDAEEGAALEAERREMARRNIQLCGHMMEFPWNNMPAAVYIKPVSGVDPCSKDPLSGNYFLCQHCQARIHPGQPVEGFSYDSVRDVFDTETFNQLWRASRDAKKLG